MKSMQRDAYRKLLGMAVGNGTACEGEVSKFIYSILRNGAGAKELELAIEWLIQDAGSAPESDPYKQSRVLPVGACCRLVLIFQDLPQ
jgi:hypothetical protein